MDYLPGSVERENLKLCLGRPVETYSVYLPDTMSIYLTIQAIYVVSSSPHRDDFAKVCEDVAPFEFAVEERWSKNIWIETKAEISIFFEINHSQVIVFGSAVHQNLVSILVADIYATFRVPTPTQHDCSNHEGPQCWYHGSAHQISYIEY